MQAYVKALGEGVKAYWYLRFYVVECPMFQKYWMYGKNGGMNPCLFMLF
jgi:hypothetical protein